MTAREDQKTLWPRKSKESELKNRSQGQCYNILSVCAVDVWHQISAQVKGKGFKRHCNSKGVFSFYRLEGTD